MIRVRSWHGEQPLPNLDITTGSHGVAIKTAAELVERYGSYDDVSISFPGERPFKGDDLRRLVERWRDHGGV